MPCRTVTLRYQRDQAKAMQKYFAALAEADVADRAKCVPMLAKRSPPGLLYPW